MHNRTYKRRWRLILFSVLLHLFLFLGIVLFAAFGFFKVELPQQPQKNKPLVLTLEAPPPTPPKQVMETPESARTEKLKEPPEYFSDKTARAQNEKSPENVAIGRAYSDGITSQPDPEEQPLLQEQVDREQAERPLAEKIIKKRPRVPNKFSKDFLKRNKSAERKKDVNTFKPGELTRERFDNKATRSLDLGAFSLNTYEWDFAPYLLRLKRKIEKNIFPPPAFTRMGLIGGKTLLKFRISPDGKLSVLEVIRFDGHEILRETSTNAIELSAPFDKLPRNFPEKFLEITAHFEYLNRRR